MTSTSETGHAKNVANFEDLISFCQGYGVAYNPVKNLLKIPQLNALYVEANNVMDELKLGKTNFDIATNTRKNAFIDIKSLSTKIVNAFAVLVDSELAIADAKGINKKLQGISARKKMSSTEISESEMAPKYISTSQQSYDRQIDHFASMVQLLEQYPEYKPNESNLTIEHLRIKLNLLKSTNTGIINTYTIYSNAMMRRNKLLYDNETGLVKISKHIKQYIKSIFGATSSEFKQVNGLEFKTLKR